MMRGLRPLVSLVALAWAASAAATEMVEIPTPPSPPPPAPSTADPCCVAVATAPPHDPGRLLLQVSVGPTYRRAFREDLAAAAVELEAGGQTSTFAIGGRLAADFGATRVGLPYQRFTIGPAFWRRMTPRLRLAFGMTFGSLVYERVSAARVHDPTVWALTIGADFTATVDLMRTSRGGALYALVRAGYDCIDNTGRDALATGSSGALTAALGYRY
jgi:hypothetical protein